MPLELAPADVQRLLAAAAQRVRAAVCREAKPSVEALLGDPLARLTVWGAFVSLKLGAELRSCCGACGEMGPLAAALASAAERAATSDPRFDPIQRAELDHLTLEVWLLDSPDRLPAIGALRANGVEVGRHGLQVTLRRQRGLLLPSVAERSGWTSEEFLRQTCVKAGLPPAAWLADDVEVQTFEGRAWQAPLAEALAGVTQPPQSR
jgi:AmmeMemoRadiSam system protein A